MARSAVDPAAALFQMGLMKAGHTQRSAAESLGLSRRTLVRMAARKSAPSEHYFKWLAREVYPHDAAMAEKLAAHAGETLVTLGIVAPPPPPPPPPPPAAPRVTDAELADIVVYAAASFLDASPKMLKPCLAVAFARAKELGLSVETMATVLAGEERAKARR